MKTTAKILFVGAMLIIVSARNIYLSMKIEKQAQEISTLRNLANIGERMEAINRECGTNGGLMILFPTFNDAAGADTNTIREWNKAIEEWRSKKATNK